jgi:LuxR family maltose regulon positive regulatory protein
MVSPLVGTKLYIPKLRRGVVARPRLSEYLSRGAESRLTLISAPAGFGKTTLLSAWLAGSAAEQRSVAWLSLEEGDSRPGLFWTYARFAGARSIPTSELTFNAKVTSRVPGTPGRCPCTPTCSAR